MRIFLLPIDSRRYTGYFEEDPAAREAERNQPVEPKGRWSRIKAKLAEGYQRLEERRPVRERLAARLRKPERIEIVYPDDLSESEARDRFVEFLKRQAQHERSWKKRDALLACLGAPLFFLPGPNIWFYYPAIRALGHHYAESGCKRLLQAQSRHRPQPALQFTPSPELTEIRRLMPTQGRRRLDKSRLAQIGRKLGLAALATVYR